MQALSLGKGQNTALEAGIVTFRVVAHGTPADVSAVLLGANGKVRGDDDLVFHGHPEQSGVSLSGDTVTLDLPRIPEGVDTVVVVASVEASRRGAVFTTAPVLTGAQGGSLRVTFAPPPFAAGETVVVLAEVYRRAEAWKLRAVGQGYATGLAGLAADFGVDVDDDARPARLPAQRRPAVPAKVEAQAPALAGTARQAGQALARTGAAGRRAAVYLLLDHDWSMQELYASSAVQSFAERVLALAVTLDDDGVVPVVFASGNEPFVEEIRLDNYPGRIQELHTRVAWGWGNVSAGMRFAVDHYGASGAAEPAFAIVQVADEPWDKPEFRALLQNTAHLDVFWLFVGFGHGRLAFFHNLDASSAAGYPNVAFFEASRNPGAVSEERFYAGLLDAFGAWMSRRT
ncbi:VWA domain-containing protein [Streptomyces sp. NPDC049040]|uniref:VWA domain-containing protein n=1 Tax=Streptomyces sp. NPDC049040 TaxID=3365593 RepID=UPI003722E75E